MPIPSPRIRISRETPVGGAAGLDWSVVLVGADSPPVTGYLSSRLGHHVAWPYLRVEGAPSMLERTLGRLRRVAPPSRTLAVIGAADHDLARAQLDGRADHVVCLPSPRDTGFALYLALAMIRRWDPEALVTVVLAGHHVAPDGAYAARLAAARRLAAELPDLVVVLGARPDGYDGDVDYLVVGEPLAEHAGAARIVEHVRRPAAAVAQQLAPGRALWSTSSACGRLAALWALGRAAASRLAQTLDSLVPMIGTEDEDDAIDYIHRAYLPVSFARDVIARAPSRCVALPLDGVTWCDAGTPAKLEALLGGPEPRRVAAYA